MSFVKIFINDLPFISKKLTLTDKLSKIREELENDIDDDILLFLKKANEEFYEVKREEENNLLLEDIIIVDNNMNILNLQRNFHWKYEYKLCYGRNMSFDGMKVANKMAFKLIDCRLKLIGAEGFKKGRVEFKSNDDWMRKTNLFFTTDFDANPVGLEILIEKLKNKNFKFNEEVKLTYRYTEIGKVSLKLTKENLELTDDFKNDVIYAMKSRNPRKELKEIIKEYGQIIPTEFIFGGRAYFRDGDKPSTSKFYGFNRWKLLGGKHSEEENFNEKYWVESLKDYQNWECIEFKNPISIFCFLPDDLRKKVIESIGKRILYKSTEDCDYDLDEPRMPKIHKLDNLPQNILKIIQNEDADCDFFATVVDTEGLRNVFFNCQILRPSNGKPSIIIHCVQKKSRKYKYKLKIGLMVSGYDIDFELIRSKISVEVIKRDGYDSQNPREFYSIPLEQKWDLGLMKAGGNPFFGIPILSDLDSLNNSLIIGHNFRDTQIDTFSYSLQRECYVNLPKFTFCTFIIILNNTSNAYSSLPINFILFRKPYFDLEGGLSFWFIRKLYERIFGRQKFTSRTNPKYISLYLSNDNDYKPFFLQQKINRISLKYIDCNCQENCFICNNKTKGISRNDNNICILFDPIYNYK